MHFCDSASFLVYVQLRASRLPYNANTAQIERRNVTGKNLHYVKLESFFLLCIGQTKCVTFIAGAARFMTSVHCDRKQRVPDGIALYLISNVALADAICQPERSILAAGSYSRGKQIAGFFLILRRRIGLHHQFGLVVFHHARFGLRSELFPQRSCQKQHEKNLGGFLLVDVLQSRHLFDWK